MRHRKLLTFDIVKSNPINQTLCDITDGIQYKANCFDSGSTQRLNLVLSVDGIPVEKSGNKSYWPVWASICELPINLRSSFCNMILCGVWFGKGKPCWETFFPKIKEQFCNLKSKFTLSDAFDQMTVNVIGLVCDLPAKASILNMIQFNGYYGCTYCLSPGLHMDKKHVYPSHSFEVRTVASYEADVELSPNHGVKGLSVLSDIIKIPAQIPIDYMHETLEGVLTSLLSLYMKQKLIDMKVLEEGKENCDVPNCFNRSIRSLRMLSFWKASESKFFLLYTGPILLSKALDERHFMHFYLLSTCIRRLLGHVRIDDLPIIEEGLRTFVDIYESTFGVINMSMNIHLLLHLVDCVRNFGPLSGFSAFSFESASGSLVRLATGKRYKCKSTIARFLHKAAYTNRSITHKGSVSKSGIVFQESDQITDNSAVNVLHSLNIHHNVQLYIKVKKVSGAPLMTKKYCANLKFKNYWVTGLCSLKNKMFFGSIEWIFYDPKEDDICCIILSYKQIDDIPCSGPSIILSPRLNGELRRAGGEIVVRRILAKDATLAVVCHHDDKHVLFVPVLENYEHD